MVMTDAYCFLLLSRDDESESEVSSVEDEHVSSTVPELVGVNLPEDIKLSDHTSWLHRRSRTPSPKDTGPVQLGARLFREKKKEKGGGGGGDGGGGDFPPPRKPQSYKPMLVSRNQNEVRIITCTICWHEGFYLVYCTFFSL